MNLTQHRVQVVRAEVADRATLVRLLQFYLYDFSAFAKADEPYGDVGDDGSVAYEHFESYWSNHRREPLLLRTDCQLVGFALVNDWSASGCAVDYCMAEFFVLRKIIPDQRMPSPATSSMAWPRVEAVTLRQNESAGLL